MKGFLQRILHDFMEIKIIIVTSDAWLMSLLSHWTIYSATIFLETCRKVVLEKWFWKLRFFFLVNNFSQIKFIVDLWYKTTLFLVNQCSRTRFLEPLFSNHFSTLFFKSGCRLNGQFFPRLNFWTTLLCKSRILAFHSWFVSNPVYFWFWTFLMFCSL